MKRKLALAAVWTLPSAVMLAATAAVYSAYRIVPPARLPADARAAIVAPLRAALADTVQPCTYHAAAQPVAVTVWLDGHAVARTTGHGGDLAAATDDAAAQLRAWPQLHAYPAAMLERARIQVDLVSGRAPVGDTHWLVGALGVPGLDDTLAINAGIDGIGADIAGHDVLVLPHELVTSKFLATSTPSEAIPDFTMGVDLRKLAALVASRAGARIVPAAALFRFRTDTFVEQPQGHRELPPLLLVRGMPPAPALSAQALRDAALLGGRYLVAHLAPNGRYIYEHDLATGNQTNPASGSYSMPRHAGSTYFLAELYRLTKEPWLREPIERAITHLSDLLAAGHCGGALPDGTPYDCVLDKTEQQAQLGSTALAVVALVEYQRATGDLRYAPLARKLAAFILYMQRADGSFRHLFDPRTKRPVENVELLYYTGEAALALARMHEVTGEARYAQAAERALDWLVGWYDFFVGGFFYGEEHWTCIAAEALWPAVKKPAYRAFCDGFGEFLRTQQPRPGEHPDEDDLAGAYGFTPFVSPFNTPTGSHTEAMISAYQLDLDHGAPDPRTLDQIRRALRYLLGQQIRPDSDFAVVGPGDGGIPATPTERTVRIDYVQHVCSAMIRASAWIDADAP